MAASLAEMLSYPFMVRALTVGALVALCAALLGVSLVLKRYSMIGDGLSHVGFGALAVAAAVNAAPLAVAVPVVTLAAFLLLRISDNRKINGDAAVAMISAGSLAIGVVAVSLAGTNIDVNSYMFGSILSLGSGDVFVSVILSVTVLALYLLFFRKIFAVTFDEGFARATGIRAGLYNTLLAILVAITTVLGMRLMGALLISSLIIFPPLTSMRLFTSFRGVVISSAAVSVVCFVTGLAASYFLGTPSGASVVCVDLAVFIAACAIKLVSGAAKRPHSVKKPEKPL